MTDIFKKIKKWFESMSFKKTSYEKDGIKPKRDWYIVLFVTFILACLCADVARFLFRQIDQGKFFVSKNQIVLEPVVIDNQLLQKTIDGINSRQKDWTDFLQNKSVPTDPSL